jgi:hypothetical protein
MSCSCFWLGRSVPQGPSLPANLTGTRNIRKRRGGDVSETASMRLLPCGQYVPRVVGYQRGCILIDHPLSHTVAYTQRANATVKPLAVLLPEQSNKVEARLQ